MSEYVIEIPDYVPPFDPFARAATLGEEVVRCLDCRYSKRTLFGEPAELTLVCTAHLRDFPTRDDGFCHMGVRRDA